MALVLPLAVLTSCNKDDDEDITEEEYTVINDVVKSGDDYCDDVLRYSVNKNDEATVKGLVGVASEVKMPSAIRVDGKICKVVTVNGSAFANNSNLMSVVIGDKVKSIKEWAFGRCPNLRSVTVPESVKSIGVSAFTDCVSLVDLTIDGGALSKIDNGVFYGCKSLQSVYIPDGVKSIGRGAFGDCTSLTDVSLPIGTETLYQGAFSGCTALEEVKLPYGLLTIEDEVFSDCSRLANIYDMALEPQKLGKNVFSGIAPAAVLHVKKICLKLFAEDESFSEIFGKNIVGDAKE